MLPARRHDISRLEGFSGFSYFLMGSAHWIYGVRTARRRKALESQLELAGNAVVNL